MTNAQLEYAFKHMPLIEARKHYPIARLHADVLNRTGGKPDPNEEDKGKVVRPESQYTAEELLPWYAYFDEPQARMSVATARDLVNNVRHLPAWARDVAPIEEARRLLADAS